jgi:indole-3-glycerol phosphate synthase
LPLLKNQFDVDIDSSEAFYCMLNVIQFQISYQHCRMHLFMSICVLALLVCVSFGSQVNYLQKLVQKKKFEVDNLLRNHQDLDDPLVMRMSYMASHNQFEVTKALKRPGDGEENLHTMSVLCDLKRRSPTIPSNRNILEFSSASKFAEVLTLAQVDGFLINTEPYEYGGSMEELKECVQVSRAARPQNPPCLVQKDLIIHPVQIAKALEEGASGVLIIMAVVGADLEPLLDACTIMGTEAIVEVHSPEELDYALSKGATIFLVNMWDRMTGVLHKEQAKGLASMMPMNAVSIAAGDIGSLEEAAELAFYGYDSVVLGRRIADMPDIKDYIDGVHSIVGPPRGMSSGGMKSMLPGLG